MLGHLVPAALLLGVTTLTATVCLIVSVSSPSLTVRVLTGRVVA
ncbi:hypothetical protein AB0F72_19225 [Actinoplanes sp. NPDC023936]